MLLVDVGFFGMRPGPHAVKFPESPDHHDAIKKKYEEEGSVLSSQLFE